MSDMVSVQIRTRGGDLFGGMVQAGSSGHAEVLSWQERLTGWQVTHPDEFLPLGTYRIRVGDVASIDVEEAR